MEYVDALPFVVDALEKALEVEGELYAWNDGHPLEGGYGAYAAAAKVLVHRLEVSNRSGVSASGGRKQ